MKSSLIPARVIGFAFYRKYFALFTIFFYFAFGILTAKEHRMFAEMVDNSTILLTGLLIIWSVYTLWTTIFSKNQFGIKPNLIFRQLSFLPIGFQVYWIGLLVAALVLPVTFYAIFLAYNSNHIINIGLLLAYILLIHFIPSYYLIKKLRQPISYGTTLSQGAASLSSSPPFWPILHLINDKALTVIVLKVISGGIIYLSGVWDNLDYDLRWWTLGMLFAAIPSVLLMKDIADFLQSQKKLFNQLPLSRFRQLILLSTIALLVYTPDLILLLRHFSYSRGWFSLVPLMMFGFSTILLALVYFIQTGSKLEELLARIFFTTIIIFLLIMFNINLFIISVGLLIIICVWHFKSSVFLK